jgi:HTH-type transcriptional regulator, transcriptional repressor of NAD biosynthesis genes
MNPPVPIAGSGLIIGKFMPPHRGHQYLVEFARACVGHLTVVLLSRSKDPIPGDLRFAWLKTLFPDAEVAHIRHELPTDYQDPAVWEEWIALIRRACPDGPDLVFSSEFYGEELARRLGSRHVAADRERIVVPVSATLIREQPLKYRQYIPDCVWPYFEQSCRLAELEEGTFALAVKGDRTTGCS